MKKRIISLLTFISLIFTLVSCGEFISGSEPGGDNPSGEVTNPLPDDGTEGGEGGTEVTDEKLTFTVTVMLNGKPYTPEETNSDNALKVRWSTKTSSHTEKVGADGKASAIGLDGEYSVTLLNIPNDYTYNPNIHKATNSNPDIQIELVKLTKTVGSGKELYKCVTLNKTGNYRAELTSADHVIYYEFKPGKSGAYIVESMVDISSDMYNPIVKVYTGTSAAKFEQAEIDGGGESGSYTTNFKYVIEVPETYLGNSYTFAIRVEGKDAVYPTYVDFSLTYKSTVDDIEKITSNLILVEFDFYDSSRFPNGYKAYLDADKQKFGSEWIDAAQRVDGKYVFNEDVYKLNPDDGFYHLYDPVKYAAYGGWGPILYADITIPHIFTVDETALNRIEYAGNTALTVSEGKENYKLFIEGFDALTAEDVEFPIFCNKECDCLPDNGGACLESDNCSVCAQFGCTPVPDKAYGMKGYADYAVNGRAPVTEELKIFLQKFSENQRYFSDGNGWVETFGYTAFEDSQWLFPCGYYQ